MTHRLKPLPRLVFGLLLLAAALAPATASARVFIGVGIGLPYAYPYPYSYPYAYPYYYRPPVVYYPAPGYYVPPPGYPVPAYGAVAATPVPGAQLSARCNTPAAICPLPAPSPIGGACTCPAAGGVSSGRVG